MLNKWFHLSEGYIFVKWKTKEFNNKHHQHQGTYGEWCALLHAIPMPLDMYNRIQQKFVNSTNGLADQQSQEKVETLE